MIKKNKGNRMWMKIQKKIFFLFFASQLLLLPTLHPSEANSIEESKIFGKEKVDAIHEKGSVKLEGTEVWKTTIVEGDFFCQNASTGQIRIYGTANIDNSTIRGRAVVKGPLKITNSRFLENLEITGSYSAIHSSILNSIFVYRPEAYEGKLVIELFDQASLKGSVIFSGGRGELILNEGCSIRGAVVGGITTQR